jgi:endonuclease YncB( thermonuclease family)
MLTTDWKNFPLALHDFAGGWKYRAVVDYWHDADTVIAVDNYGKRLYQTVEYRLLRVNAPEVDAPIGSPERDAAMRALLFTTHIMPPGTFFVAVTRRDQRSFNRYLAELFYLKDGLLQHANNLVLDEQRRTDNWGLGL